jgi:hypothetical protein
MEELAFARCAEYRHWRRRRRIQVGQITWLAMQSGEHLTKQLATVWQGGERRKGTGARVTAMPRQRRIDLTWSEGRRRAGGS